MTKTITTTIAWKKKKKKKKKKRKIQRVDLSDSSNSSKDFEVFNQALSPEGTPGDVNFQHQAEVITSDEMGI